MQSTFFSPTKEKKIKVKSFRNEAWHVSMLYYDSSCMNRHKSRRFNTETTTKKNRVK